MFEKHVNQESSVQEEKLDIIFFLGTDSVHGKK